MANYNAYMPSKWQTIYPNECYTVIYKYRTDSYMWIMNFHHGSEYRNNERRKDHAEVIENVGGTVYFNGLTKDVPLEILNDMVWADMVSQKSVLDVYRIKNIAKHKEGFKRD